MRASPSRREFLSASLRPTLALAAGPGLLAAGCGSPTSPAGAKPLAARFPDAGRHFVFEYYPWYATNPVLHWDHWDRVPPHDIAATHMPRLGPYDSRDASVLDAHARWIAESGVGAVNLSWWGQGSFEDRAVHGVMDAMHAHGLKVTFHLEPYADDRPRRYAEDVLYLVREYGEKRRFDCLLLLRDEDGRQGPVLKSFATLLPAQATDCHGVRRAVAGHAPDGVWARQTDEVRRALRGQFDHVRLLADSLDWARTAACGFDGSAIYDNFEPPQRYATHAAAATLRRMLFSFNVNPGFDAIEPRSLPAGSCHRPRPFAPDDARIDWTSDAEVERAAGLARRRITASLEATLAAQSEPGLLNARRGFLLVYVNSFNEWHEGTAFEPMKDRAALTVEEAAIGYHNPARGDERLRTLKALMARALA